MSDRYAADLDAIETDGAEPDGGAGWSRRRSATTNRWMRWLHAYTSMISLVVVLFFGVTGLTLNHPTWTLGDAIDRSVDEGTLPGGYRTDGGVDFSVETGEYELTVEQQGFVGVMNDLHKGRDAPGSWKWIIDISAGLLVLVAVTGLGIQLFQRKRRTRALVFAGVGLVLTILFVCIALA